MVVPHLVDLAGAVLAESLMECPRGVEVAEDARPDRSLRQRRRTAENALAGAARHLPT
jgi:hypothetical protein